MTTEQKLLYHSRVNKITQLKERRKGYEKKIELLDQKIMRLETLNYNALQK